VTVDSKRSVSETERGGAGRKSGVAERSVDRAGVAENDIAGGRRAETERGVG